MKFLLNLIFPPKCIICESYSDQENICGKCWSKISFITKPYCAICGYPFEYEEDENAICGLCIKSKPNYTKAISLFKYDEYSKALIHKFKYQDQLQLLEYFSRLMLNMGKELIDKSSIIAPVPMHRYKLIKRGYNQSALLAMKIASKQKLDYFPELLIKKDYKTAQTGLKKEQRFKNIKNAFALNEKFIKSIKGKNILLIDDVITTGATISECCKILNKAKPSKIFILSLAKTI